MAFDHMTAIKSGEITKTTVIGLRKALNVQERRYQGYSTSSTAPKITDAQLRAMMSEIERRAPKIVGELHDTGIALLTSKRYKRQLEKVAKIVPDVTSFHLVGFEMLGQRGLYAIPVYRASTDDGRNFDFYNVPWQSGGNGPVIV